MGSAISYVTFNILEAGFWIVLGTVGFTLRNVKEKKYRSLAIFVAIVLVLFGISDILEAYAGNFLEQEMYWLFIWKFLNVVGINAAIVWYLYLRFFK